MTRSIVIATSGLAALIAGCNSGGLSTREGGRNTQPNYLAAMYGDVDVTTQPAAARRPFAGPARLAVAQVGEVAPPQAMLDKLVASPAVFAHVDSLPAIAGADDGYRYRGAAAVDDDGPRRQSDVLRRMAASVGADYLLLVGGTVDASHSGTALSVLNATIVGLFVVPSERLSADMKASGALVDVRTGQVVSLTSAQVVRSTLVPLASSDADGMRKLGQMRDDVTAALAEKVIASCAADAARPVATR